MAGFEYLKEKMVVQEAAAGVKSLDLLIESVSRHRRNHNQQLDCRELTDFTVSKFKNVASLLGRTGHARFRRAPVQPRPPPLTDPVQHFNLASRSSQHQKPASGMFSSAAAARTCPFDVINSGASVGKAVGGMTSAASRSTGKDGWLSLFPWPAAATAGKPPLSGKRSRERDNPDEATGSGPSRCHCCKNRPPEMKTVIKVPVIRSKDGYIPPDQHSWRKYGERPIKGLAYPRSYFRCKKSECPAKKYVERAMDDPMLLIVTYEGEHMHAY